MKLDPKVIFYLKHRRQIEEWNAIKKRVAPYAHKFFLGLEPGLHDVVERMGEDFEFKSHLEGNWPRFQVDRPSWCPEESPEPVISVCFEWRRGSATFRNAYVGLRPDFGRAGWEAVRDAACSRVFENDTEVKFKRDGKWAAYREEPPTKRKYWEDLDRLRCDFHEIIEQRWRLLVPFVDLAVEDLRGEDSEW